MRGTFGSSAERAAWRPRSPNFQRRQFQTPRGDCAPRASSEEIANGTADRAAIQPSPGTSNQDLNRNGIMTPERGLPVSCSGHVSSLPVDGGIWIQQPPMAEEEVRFFFA